MVHLRNDFSYLLAVELVLFFTSWFYGGSAFSVSSIRHQKSRTNVIRSVKSGYTLDYLDKMNHHHTDVDLISFKIKKNDKISNKWKLDSHEIDYEDLSRVENVEHTIQNEYGRNYKSENQKEDAFRIKDDINYRNLTEKKKSDKNSEDKLPFAVDIVTKFLRIVETQHLLGENCTAGTDLNLGEGVVDRYAQERFRVEADVAVNRANMLTRLWKYADPDVLNSEYLLHASVVGMVEFDDDIFAAGNCYDEYQYKDYWLFCPYAFRLPDGPILAKNLAIEYKYMTNSSEWFFIARKSAERIIKNHDQFKKATPAYLEVALVGRIKQILMTEQKAVCAMSPTSCSVLLILVSGDAN